MAMAPEYLNAGSRALAAGHGGAPHGAPGAGDHEDEAMVSLRDLWRVVLKRYRQVLLVAALVLGAALVYTLLATPLYRASATVQIESSALRIVTSDSLEVMDPSGDFIGTQTELLRSRSVALRAVRDLALVGDEAFQKALYQPRGWRSVLSYFRAEKTAPWADETLEVREAAAVRAVQGGLTVNPVRRTRVVEIGFVSPNPLLAQRIANGVAAAFMQSNLDRRVDNTAFARKFLEDRLQQTKLKLEDSERALIGFAQKQNIANLDETIGLVRKTQDSLNTELATVQAARIKAEAQLEQFDSKAGVSLDSLKSAALEGMRQKLADLQADYEAKRSQYKPDYPEMQQLALRIREVKTQMAEESGAFQRATQGEARAARANETLLLRQIGKVQTELLALQGRSIQFNILKREADTNRQLYDGLLQRYKEIGVEGSSSANNISMLDPAQNGSLFKPNFQTNLLLGLVLGLALGVGFVLLLEKLDDTLKTPDDIERQLRLPVLGLVPLVPEDEFADALLSPRSSLAEAYRSLRTSLQYATESGAPRVLIITSSSAGEGKSTSSMVLASQSAQSGLRVLLVDADLRKPSLHTRFGLPNDSGLSTLLKGQSALETLLHQPQEGLSLVTSGPTPANPAELLASPRFRAFMEQAAADYDQVIIDCPPLLGLADVPSIVGLADGVMMVVGAGSTRMGTARASLKRLASARANVLGAVLVKFDAGAVAYGYGYEYADHRYYGASYGAYGDAGASARRGVGPPAA
jgi:polysaccharide biosynthesis transport protein